MNYNNPGTKPYTLAHRTYTNSIQRTYLCFKRKKNRITDLEKTARSERENPPLFLSSILSSTLAMLTNEKEMCLLSTGCTDYLTDGQEGNCASLHTHKTPISPEHTSNATCSYGCSSAHLGCRENRDYAGACRDRTIKHTLDTGSVDGSGP